MQIINKIMSKSGLTRKRVRIQRKGEKPFWSYRWVREGEPVKPQIEKLGFKILEVEEKEKEKASGKSLLDRIIGTKKFPGIGIASYMHAQDLQPGDTQAFSGGERQIVKQVIPAGKSVTIIYEAKDPRSGEHWQQKKRAKTDVAVHVPKESKPVMEVIPKPETQPKVIDVLGELERKFKDFKDKTIEEGKKKPKQEVVLKPTVILEPVKKPEAVKKPETQPKVIDVLGELERKFKDFKDKTIEEGKKEAKPSVVLEPKPESRSTVHAPFVPLKSLDEAESFVRNSFVRAPSEKLIEKSKLYSNVVLGKDGVNLGTLNLKLTNQLIEGLNQSMGEYGLKLDYVGWNPGKQKGILAKYTRTPDLAYKAIQFQKTATKQIKSTMENTSRVFEEYHSVNVNTLQGNLDRTEELYPESKSLDTQREQLAISKATTRQLVASSDPKNALKITATHEGMHYVYYSFDLQAKWEKNIEAIDPVKIASVSEYAQSSPAEMFAEVGAAVKNNIKIHPDMVQAFEKTMETIKK